MARFYVYSEKIINWIPYLFGPTIEFLCSAKQLSFGLFALNNTQFKHSFAKAIYIFTFTFLRHQKKSH